MTTQAPKDSDFDGLMDDVEERFGTNPLLWDTDGDGQGDGLEVALGKTDPTMYDRQFPLEVLDQAKIPSPQDPDGDGLPFHIEQRLATRADDPDSDGDGLSDWVEMIQHHDPNSQYSDGYDAPNELDAAVNAVEVVRDTAVQNAVEPSIILPNGSRMEWGPAERPAASAMEPAVEPADAPADFAADTYADATDVAPAD